MQVRDFVFLMLLSAPLHAASVGPIFPSTCSNVTVAGAGTAWVNPSSATVEDGNLATGTGATSQYLYCSGYDFSSIPTGSIISGVVIEGKEASITNQNIDNSVRLFESGSPAGNDNSVGAVWPVATPTWESYGAASDLWGLSLTKAIVTDPLFGAGISVIKNGGGATSYAMDAERMTIFYAAAASGPTTIYNGTINNGQLH